MKNIKNKKGFTLAELLVVVAIIAILVAVMVPVFTSSTKRAKLETATANVRSKYAELVMDAMNADDYNGQIDIDQNELEKAAGEGFSVLTHYVTEGTEQNAFLAVCMGSGLTSVPSDESDYQLIDVDDGIGWHK